MARRKVQSYNLTAINDNGIIGYVAVISRRFQVRAYPQDWMNYDKRLTKPSYRRLLRCLAGEPVFGRDKHSPENYPNSTAWYLDNFDRQK